MDKLVAAAKFMNTKRIGRIQVNEFINFEQGVSGRVKGYVIIKKWVAGADAIRAEFSEYELMTHFVETAQKLPPMFGSKVCEQLFERIFYFRYLTCPFIFCYGDESFSLT
jgi:hypothetical protein